MALVDHDSWDIEQDGCERLREELIGQLKQREQYQDLTPIYDQLTARIQTGLEQLRKDVQHLKTILDAATTWETRSPEELARRRRVWETLTTEWKELVENFTKTTRPDRRAHFDRAAGTSRAAWQTTGGGNDPTPAVGIPSDVAALKRRQIEMMENQNQGLEALSQTLSRQRELASQLGQEVEDQNDILDNLANTLGRVEDGVQRETGNIGQVSRRDSTWGYWLVIIALFVAIVVVAWV